MPPLPGGLWSFRKVSHFSFFHDSLFLCAPNHAIDGDGEFRLGCLGKKNQPLLLDFTLASCRRRKKITHQSTKIQILVPLKSFLTEVSVLG